MIQIEKPDNLVDHFEISTERFKNNKLFGTKNKKTGQFEWVTYGDVRKRVDNFRGGLASLKIKAGDSIGIIASNRTEWAVAAFATYGLQARFIPMYEKETTRTWEYIIQDANIRFLLVSKREIYQKVEPLLSKIESLEFIYIIEDDSEISMLNLEKKGEKSPVNSEHPKYNQVAGLIYTSGTTGEPKGVLLTHGTFTSNARAGYHRYPMLKEHSRSLSILPWAHSYGQVAELYNWFYFGGSIGFMESVETLAEDLVSVKPTFLIAVPRVFNKIFDGINTKMEETGGLPKRLFEMGLNAAKKDRLANGQSGLVNKMKLKFARKVVFSKIQEKFGGALEGSITASAKMNSEISQFYMDIGLPVYDCYGLSETGPAVTMNAPDLNRPGSVGKPLEYIQVRIDKSMLSDNSKDGEIQVMGPNLMLGYHNKPKATAEVFTEDGWIKTGDRGRLDEDGYVYITGRIKEQFKLENGKYVFPAAIEEDIRLLPYIENAMIYGDGKAYNTCIIVLNCDILGKTAESFHLKSKVNKLINSPVVQEFIGKEIQANLKQKYGGYEIPRKFIFTDEDFTLENGMLTQTLKLKRRNVLKKYQERLEALYLS
jgi:long-chain acyl-CoA synthetase